MSDHNDSCAILHGGRDCDCRWPEIKALESRLEQTQKGLFAAHENAKDFLNRLEQVRQIVAMFAADDDEERLAHCRDLQAMFVERRDPFSEPEPGCYVTESGPVTIKPILSSETMPDQRYLTVKCEGAGDDGEFDLFINHRQSYEPLDAIPCKHAFNVETYTAGKEYGGNLYKMKRWRWPFAVMATNQGGHDCTTVCLDCAIEARDRMLAGEGHSYSEPKEPYENES